MHPLLTAVWLIAGCSLTASASASAAALTPTDAHPMISSPSATDTLSARQQALIPIAALAAAGDMPRLNTALDRGLDAGLPLNEAKEVLVQLYAYAGFPRSLNGLGELMKVVAARQQRGLQDRLGPEPTRAIPTGEALLAAGTANQTQLIGAPAKGPLSEFAPAVDRYLKTHLFGDIFERDNLDWKSRELATVSMLAALDGVASQLQSHVGISMNIGITAAQLTQLAQVLARHVDADAGHRVEEALHQHLASQSASSAH